MLAAFPTLIQHPSHQLLIDTWNHFKGWGRWGSNAQVHSSAEEKLELGAVWNIFTHIISERGFVWWNFRKDDTSNVKTFSRLKWYQVLLLRTDPLVSSAAVCVLLITSEFVGGASTLCFCTLIFALVSHLIFSLQFLIFRGQMNFNSQICFIVPIYRFLGSSIRSDGEAVLSWIELSLQAAKRAESLVVFRRGYSQKFFIV